MEKNEKIPCIDNLPYEELNRILIEEANDIETLDKSYLAFNNPDKRHFIFFARTEKNSYTEPTTEGIIFNEFGLKFHISLPEDDLVKFSKGWDIKKKYLLIMKLMLLKLLDQV